MSRVTYLLVISISVLYYIVCINAILYAIRGIIHVQPLESQTTAGKLQTNPRKLSNQKTNPVKSQTNPRKLSDQTTSIKKLHTTTGKLQTTTRKLQTNIRKLQTNRLESSVRKLQTTTRKLQTTTRKLQTNPRISQTNIDNTFYNATFGETIQKWQLENTYFAGELIDPDKDFVGIVYISPGNTNLRDTLLQMTVIPTGVQTQPQPSKSVTVGIALVYHEDGQPQGTMNDLTSPSTNSLPSNTGGPIDYTTSTPGVWNSAGPIYQDSDNVIMAKTCTYMIQPRIYQATPCEIAWSSDVNVVVSTNDQIQIVMRFSAQDAVYFGGFHFSGVFGWRL